MSMTTRCPDCATLFKVVADQLRMSEGWVRCGKCGLVFDGRAHLQGDEVVPPAVQVEASDTFTSTTESWTPGGEVPVSPSDTVANPVDPSPEVTFVKVAKRKARWRNPWLRAFLGMLVLFLLSALALQAVIHERHRLVATFPEVRPWLQHICQPLDCSLGPVQLLDAIVVESSTFQRLRGEQYRLVVQVRNSASIEVAMPAVELTLKDSRDEVLLRRVMRPGDFSTADGAIAAQGEWTGKAVVQITDLALAGRIANFSTLAFYP